MNFSTCLMCGVSALSAALVTSIIVLHQQQSRVVVVVEAKPAQAQAYVAPLEQPPVARQPPVAQPAQEPVTPIAIPTRGQATGYEQVGVLYEGDTVIPLYGRPTYPGSGYWNYYTKTPNYHDMPLGLEIQNRDCVADSGCKEISSGDPIKVTELGGRSFTAKVYNKQGPRYLPGVL
jgi:hypothetical protein